MSLLYCITYADVNKKDGFVVLAISIDPSEGPVRSAVSETGITFPVLRNPDKDVSFDDYAVFALPTSFLIGRDETIARKFIGEEKWDSPTMKDTIERCSKRGENINGPGRKQRRSTRR